MEIKHTDNAQKGSFYIEVDGKSEGNMTYVWAGQDKMIIDHTEVGEKLKGKGAGKQLLHAAVLFARERQVKILPLCLLQNLSLTKLRNIKMCYFSSLK